MSLFDAELPMQYEYEGVTYEMHTDFREWIRFELLMTDPDILLLDEPTKGLDGAFKEKLAVLLKDLCQKGKTIVLVSHDMAFCAEYADTCGLLFDGQMISQEKTETFFRENVFYTTPAARMAQGIFTDCFRAEDVIRALQKVRAG